MRGKGKRMPDSQVSDLMNRVVKEYRRESKFGIRVFTDLVQWAYEMLQKKHLDILMKKCSGIQVKGLD